MLVLLLVLVLLLLYLLDVGVKRGQSLLLWRLYSALAMPWEPRRWSLLLLLLLLLLMLLLLSLMSAESRVNSCSTTVESQTEKMSILCLLQRCIRVTSWDGLVGR